MDRKESGRVWIIFGGSSAGAVLGAALELLGADPVCGFNIIDNSYPSDII